MSTSRPSTSTAKRTGVHSGLFDSFAVRARWFMVLAATAALSSGFAACGGTTGKPDLGATTQSNSSDGGPDATATTTSDDGGVGDDLANYDATIGYADAGRLPMTSLDSGLDGGGGGGGEAGAIAWQTWPVCPCDDLSSGLGVASTAPGCGVTDVVWTRRPACDNCWRGLATEGQTNGYLPPACSVRDAGVAAGGPATGQPIYNLVAELYACLLQTDCAANPDTEIYYCYCGSADLNTACKAGNGTGPCKAQIEAAYQMIAGSQDQGPAYVINNLRNTNLTSSSGEPNPGYGAANVVNLLFNATHGSDVPPSLTAGCTWACAPSAADAGTYVPPPPSVTIDGGGFTKTESLLYLAKPSCYACLKADGCLDDSRGDTNSECEDLAGQVVPGAAAAGSGQSREDLCYATLQCVLGSPSCLGAFSSGFSGADSMGRGNPCIAPASDAGASSGCLSQEQAGLETTDPVVMTTRFNDQTTGAGVANRILNCAYSVNCSSCFSP
jgi:hypothetical protein